MKGKPDIAALPCILPAWAQAATNQEHLKQCSWKGTDFLITVL